MESIYMKAARTLACPGVYGYDAEMQIEKDDRTVVYLHVNEYEGKHFTVSITSIFDYMTNQTTVEPDSDLIESYSSFADAVGSEYYQGFFALNELIKKYKKWRESSGDEWLLVIGDPDINFSEDAGSWPDFVDDFSIKTMEFLYDEKQNSYYFICPYCDDMVDPINGDPCEHIIYGYETVNNMQLDTTEGLGSTLLRAIGDEPLSYLPDFAERQGEYIEEEEDENDPEEENDDILEDAVCSYIYGNLSMNDFLTILDMTGLIKEVPTLRIVRFYDAYIGGGTYYAIVSDEDKKKLLAK